MSNPLIIYFILRYDFIPGTTVVSTEAETPVSTKPAESVASLPIVQQQTG